MGVLLVIPARFASTRYPGKPLVELRGATGEARSLIRRTWEAAMAVPCIERVIIATDEARIHDAVLSFGAEAAMTPTTCRNGTERCAALVATLDEPYEIVVNLQGDAPLTPPWFITALVEALAADPGWAVATPVLRASPGGLEGLLEDRRQGRVGATTAAIDAAGRALYFSKEVLPHVGRPPSPGEPIPVFHHVGVYAYRREPLMAYPGWSEGQLEHWEGLEQLRFLENGVPVHCIEVEARGRDFWELNHPGDVERLEAMMHSMGMQ